MFLSFGVIMSVQLHFLPILFSILGLSTWKLIIITFVRRFFIKISRLVLSLVKITWLTSLLNLYLLLLFFSFSKLLVDSSPYRLREDVEDEAQAAQGKGSGSTQVQQQTHHLRL